MLCPVLNCRMAEVLVRISGYYDYLKGEEDGKVAYSILPMQRWRRTTW
jgi:hypothetical protein